MKLKTYVAQYIHKYGNGWAIINATAPSQVESILKTQGRFPEVKLVSFKEVSHFGNTMSIVYEGSIATLGQTPYDLAVKNGFKGTLEEWLESLKGPKGDTGATPDMSLYYTKSESEARFAGKPFVVTFAETAGVVVADKTFAATLAAYNSGAAVYFRFSGADFPASLMGDNSFVGVFHYGNLLLEVYLDEQNNAGKNIYTLLTSGGLKTINSESLEGSGNLALATQAALNNYCPIIEDTREAVGSTITGVAPFASLVDGQMIWMHLAFDSPGSASITLTLSNGTSTGAIPFFGQTPSGGFTRISLGLYKRNHYKLCRYETDNNRWVCVNHDNDTVYYNLSTAEIETGTATQTKVVSAAVLRGVFYLKSESDTRYLPQVVSVDNQSAQVEQALESNKFYKFLNPVDELTLTLVAPTGYGDVMGIYAGKFTASSTWNSLVLPDTVEEAAGNDSISVGKRYEFNILDNVIMVKEI